MPSLTLPDRLIWFAHVPKAGGTSVEQALVGQWGDRVGHLHWGWDRWWRREGWRLADPPNSPQHLIWDDARATLPHTPDAVFALVRNPAARLASEYRYQRYARRGTRLGRVLARLPFACWLRLMLAMVTRHPHAFDNHLRPQTDFVPEGAAIFRLEDGLAPVADWLAEATGTPVSAMPHVLKSGRAPTIPPALLARIEAAYGIDYARFGYRRAGHPAPARDRFDRLAGWCAPVLVWLDRRGLL